jgi:amino acid transporter
VRIDGVRRALTCPKVLVLSFGSVLLVNVSLGPMAAELGAASVLVWIVTAFVGLLQCLLIAELGSRYPDKVGGVPAYIHEGLKHRSPLFGAVAAWAYWSGWIPGVAVHLLLAATYIRAAFWPDVNVVVLTLTLAALVYTLNYFGFRLVVWTSGVLAVCAVVPLLVIFSGALFHGPSGQTDRVWTLLPNGRAWSSPPVILLLMKWMFVAAWSSYGGEMAATLAGELRDPERDSARTAVLAGVVTFLAFAVVPIALVGTVGGGLLANDPYIVFLTAARGVFGGFGSAVVSIMLVAALMSGAQLFIISSSRALYQMSRDGLTFRNWGRVNRYGVPIGSIRWDAVVTLSMLAIFGTDVVDVVAAANVSYVLVFVLLPWAYLQVRKRERPQSGVFILPQVMVPIAWVLLVVNGGFLIVGGLQWGAQVMGVGLILMAIGVPLYRLLDRMGELGEESAAILPDAVRRDL